MHRSSFALIAATLLALAAAACSFLGERDTSVLMPLDVGNRWTYTEANEGVPVAIVTYRVVREIGGTRIPFTEIEIERRPLAGGETVVEKRYAYNEAGLWLFNSPAENRRVEAYFRYPIEAESFYWDANDKKICAGTGETTVPGGTFDVIIYGECGANFDRHRTMFTPDIGFIFWGDYARRSYFLASYELK